MCHRNRTGAGTRSRYQEQKPGAPSSSISAGVPLLMGIMKKSNFTSLDFRLIFIWLALSAVSSSASAQQTLTWDTNGGVAGTGGMGIWNTGSITWASGATFQAWNNSAFDNAIFGGTAGAISLGLPVN